MFDIDPEALVYMDINGHSENKSLLFAMDSYMT